MTKLKNLSSTVAVCLAILEPSGRKELKWWRDALGVV